MRKRQCELTVRLTGEELGVNIVDYCVYPNRENSPARFEFLIEPDRALDPDRKSTRLNSSHIATSRMPSSA